MKKELFMKSIIVAITLASLVTLSVSSFAQKPEKPKKDTKPPVIKINGDTQVDVVVGTKYEDKGATANDNVDGIVKVNSQILVNTSIVGKGKVIYTAADKAGNKESAVRTVNVVKNTTPPVITIIGYVHTYVEVGTTYKDEGATAKDKVDGVVTVKSSIKVDTKKIGDGEVEYTAVDKDGNKATATRFIKVVILDNTPPEITINGDTKVNVEFGAKYEDSGASALDDVDGN